jgi:hypothetical protein
LRERVPLLRARENRRLITEPIQISEKYEHQQAGGAQCNGEMGAGRLHQRKFAGLVG